jgi:hypothetical protein
MSLSQLIFNEDKFINEVLKQFETDIYHNTNDDIYDNYFYLVFPTKEIQDEIHNKYYYDEWYDSQSLHTILSTKVNIAYKEYEESNADTEYNYEEYNEDYIHYILDYILHNEEYNQDYFEGDD